MAPTTSPTRSIVFARATTSSLPSLRNISIVPKLKHGHIWTFPEPHAFIDAALRGGPPVAKLGDIETGEGTVRASLTAPAPPAKTEFHYTHDSGNWEKRKWITVPARLENDTVVAELPVPRPITYYLSTTDKHVVRTSTVWAELPE